MTTKKCSKCGEEKPLEDFSPHPRGALGRQACCKACYVAANSARYHANIEVEREKARVRSVEYRAKNPEKVAAIRAAWDNRNPGANVLAKKKWALANPEKVAASKRAWVGANRAQHNSRGKAWKKANPAAMKKYRLRKYGLSVDQYDALVASQDSRCAICGTDNPAKHGQWCVDHDHATKAIRGLLCISCNAGLGNFRDNPGIILAAERYLQASRRKKSA